MADQIPGWSLEELEGLGGNTLVKILREYVSDLKMKKQDSESLKRKGIAQAQVENAEGNYQGKLLAALETGSASCCVSV